MASCRYDQRQPIPPAPTEPPCADNWMLSQDDDPNTLLLIASYLLFDGQQNEVVFRMMNEECAFPRLMELLQAQSKAMGEDGAGLHRLLMDLLYEMSRIQRIKVEDLGRYFG